MHHNFPYKYIIVYFLLCHCLLVEGYHYFYIVLLIVWFFSALTVLNCKNYFNVRLILISIKLKTVCQYFLNPKMEITTTQEFLSFRLILCAIILFFGATYAITLFVDSFLCVSNICSDYLMTPSVCNRKRVFSRRL